MARSSIRSTVVFAKSLKNAEPGARLPTEELRVQVMSAFGLLIIQFGGGNVALENSSVTDPGKGNTWLTLIAFTIPSLLGSSRSEEHTSELQSQSNLVCRLL